MIDRPETTESRFTTETWASNVAASFTNLAAARACRPRRLMMFTTRVTTLSPSWETTESSVPAVASGSFT
jgi:hypothetical protein